MWTVKTPDTIDVIETDLDPLTAPLHMPIVVHPADSPLTIVQMSLSLTDKRPMELRQT
jgi:hypothetical protein